MIVIISTEKKEKKHISIQIFTGKPLYQQNETCEKYYLVDVLIVNEKAMMMMSGKVVMNERVKMKQKIMSVIVGDSVLQQPMILVVV